MNQSMNTQELIELASLDVLGLLDTDEREAFERAFRAASPELQAQIRREQLRLSGVDGLVPQVEQPLGLRARVLAAIREAMQVSGPRARDPVIGRIVPELASAHGVNRWWRAGAIGAAAAAVVFAFTTIQLRSDYDKFADASQQNQLRDMFLQNYGARFEQTFLDPNTRYVQFAPAVAAAPGVNPAGVSKAMLLLNPDTQKGQLFLKNLADAAGQYTLVITDESGNVSRAVIDFQASGTGGVERRDIEKLDLEGVRGLAIIESGDTGVRTLLRSRI